MKDLERVIGSLEEYKEWSKSEFKAIDHKLFRIINKLEDLNKARWILYGKFAILNSIWVFIVEQLLHKFSGG